MIDKADPVYRVQHPRALTQQEKDIIKSDSKRMAGASRGKKNSYACHKNSAVYKLVEDMKARLQKTNRLLRPISCRPDTWERACAILCMADHGHYATPTDETLRKMEEA